MGRFQSHLTGQSEPLNQITCLSDSGTLYRAYRQWSPDTTSTSTFAQMTAASPAICASS
jgi:hypothetical protein